MHIIDTITHDAARILGRPVKHGRKLAQRDWRAWSAVERAAKQAGLSELLWGYVQLCPSDLRVMAELYVRRYAQAYGPVDDIIDPGGVRSLERIQRMRRA